MKIVDERIGLEERKILENCIGKELISITHDAFDFNNSVSQRVQVDVDNSSFYICNFDRPEDYYGSEEDIPILSIEKTINLPALEHPVTTPFNRVIKKILIIQENQRLYENDKQIYDVWLTRGVLFDFGDGQLAFEKDNWLSSEIFIRRGYELLKEFAPEDEFMKEEWPDGVRGECSRIIEQIPDVIPKAGKDH